MTFQYKLYFKCLKLRFKFYFVFILLFCTFVKLLKMRIQSAPLTCVCLHCTERVPCLYLNTNQNTAFMVTLLLKMFSELCVNSVSLKCP